MKFSEQWPKDPVTKNSKESNQEMEAIHKVQLDEWKKMDICSYQ